MQVRVMLLVVGAAVAQYSTASAGIPGWCNGEDFKTSRYSIQGRASDGDYRTSIENVVRAACTSDPEVEPTREATEKLRLEVGKELFMNDADWTDAVAYVKERGSGRTEDVIKISETSLGALTPVDQYVATRYGFKDDDGRGAGNSGDAYYRADALGDGLTETGRLGLLENCLQVPPGFSRKDESVVDWAICAEDAQKLDPKKLAEELRGDTAHAAKERTMLHIRIGVVMQGLAKVSAAREKLIKSDEAYETVFEVAQTGRDEWRKSVGANKELLALVQSTESGRWFHSRKQFAGCEEKTQKALAEAASKIPAKLFKNMYDERDDPDRGFGFMAAPVLVEYPEFNLAATAYALCQPKSAIGGYLGSALSSTPGLRGPRTAAFTAIFHQVFALDDTQLKEVRKPRIGTRPYAGSGTWSFGGVLKSFKAGSGDDKGKMIASLEKTMIKQEECVKSHRTGRIAAITSSGEVRYEEVCDKSALVTHDHTWDPFAVSEGTAKWVKPGQLFSAVRNDGGAEVIAVWPNKSAKLPSLLFGGSIK